jgi:hypothetical protein
MEYIPVIYSEQRSQQVIHQYYQYEKNYIQHIQDLIIPAGMLLIPYPQTFEKNLQLYWWFSSEKNLEFFLSLPNYQKNINTILGIFLGLSQNNINYSEVLKIE